MTAEEKEQADLDAKQALVTQLEEVNGIAFAGDSKEAQKASV
jgi:hypothetical protein